MPTLKSIQRKWLDNFKKCPLVDQETISFKNQIAYQLFYGKTDQSYPIDYPHNFNQIYLRNNVIDVESTVDNITQFLHFIGITIQKDSIYTHLDKFPGDLEKLFRKTYYILKGLAHSKPDLNINKPYAENNGDLYFLLRVESLESLTGGQLHIFEDIDLPDLYNRYVTIPEGYKDDPQVQQLFDELECTNNSYFITGKAGTGKSTFLHYFAQNTKKKVLMLAYTGIAAINIGGQTIHSFFRFPFKPLLPEDEEIPIFNKYQDKYHIISKIEVIIIDEVSMLRSDVLEAIDYSLRMNGGDRNKRFGGKQMIFVGDLLQLPPVTNLGNGVENILFEEYYNSEYFFDAKAYKELNPKHFSFKKVHRQKDQQFVELLNAVRNCSADESCINKLNERLDHQYVPRADEFVVHLTSTNNLANLENERRLRSLEYSKHIFEAQVTGEFPEDRYPTNKLLELKRKAQIIFTRNDPSRRWVNGTIAKIDFIADDLLEVKLQNGFTHQIERVTWENRKYKYDREKKRIVSEVVGTFTQYPVKLAWAITIHKSQGLTFDNVYIDLGTGAFVSGQLYTALSRCRTLDGIKLKTRIRKEDIIIDRRLIEFH